MNSNKSVTNYYYYYGVTLQNLSIDYLKIESTDVIFESIVYLYLNFGA